MLIVIGFSLEKAKVSLDDVVMVQTLIIFGAMVVRPGEEKTPVCKHMPKNLK